MANNIFKKYSSREEFIFQKFVEKNEWFSQNLIDFRADNTGFHDLKAKMKNGETLVIQVKEDEAYWFDKTKNLGLDLLSAFKFKANREKWLENNYWISQHDCRSFFNAIDILKKGKLITCDADVHIFYVEDRLNLMFDNNKLQSDNFKKYLFRNFPIRVNKKTDYDLSDDWESCAYYVKYNDPVLSETMIEDYSSLQTAIANNLHSVSRLY